MILGRAGVCVVDWARARALGARGALSVCFEHSDVASIADVALCALRACVLRPPAPRRLGPEGLHLFMRLSALHGGQIRGCALACSALFARAKFAVQGSAPPMIIACMGAAAGGGGATLRASERLHSVSLRRRIARALGASPNSACAESLPAAACTRVRASPRACCKDGDDMVSHALRAQMARGRGHEHLHYRWRAARPHLRQARARPAHGHGHGGVRDGYRPLPRRQAAPARQQGARNSHDL